jgi:uncharacterized protein involved in exopolysaccharide biosynthesis
VCVGACRQAAVAAAEAAAAAAAEERLVEAVAQQQARVAELQSEVQRLRSSAQTYLRDEREVRGRAGLASADVYFVGDILGVVVCG